MKILILTQWYLPEPALLIQELAQTLIAHGHQVTVLTGFPNYPSGQIYPGYQLRPLQKEIIAGVPVVRVPLYPEHSLSGFKRALNYLSFAASATVFGWDAVSKPEVMFVYHPPLTIGLPAYVLSRFWRIPFVYNIADMWPETLSATGMLKNAAALKTIGRFAKWVYEKAAVICVISPGFRENLIKKGVPADKIHVISNWVDPKAYYVAAPDLDLAEELGLSNRFNVMFAGNIGEAQGVETVLEAAKLLRDLKDVQFVLVGDGVALPGLKETAIDQGLNNVLFLGRYPQDRMPVLYALADVLLVHLKDDPLFRITIPHKTLTYLASGKPILAAVAGDTNKVVTEAGAGLGCPPGNPEALAEAVRKLYHLDRAELQRMGMNGRQAAKNLYSREHLIGKIEVVLQQAAGSSRKAPHIA
jgi:glycosyltransferase involved in cell wall biosynthesis